jgi:ATP-dependent RNA helicase DbpA
MNQDDFTSLAILPALLQSLEQLDFHNMTTIQKKSLPFILENKDIIAQAKTGSGKTVSFGIGILNKLNIKKFRVQSLILCPTRELADQVANELRKLARTLHNIKILTLCGGVPMRPQTLSLQHQAHIIVGTPGRVIKHIKQQSLSLKDLDTLVLDEADRMLDMGFIDDITYINGQAPVKKQTLLFSATYPIEIQSLSEDIQDKAIEVKTSSIDTPNNITETLYKVTPKEKLRVLVNILGRYRPKTTIIFINMKVSAKDIINFLKKNNIDSLTIHGDLEQYERNDVIEQFTNKSCSILVATDVAARGLDIKDIDLVINYDLPHDYVTYIHRIGRTARAGKSGKAVSIYSDSDLNKIVEYENNNIIFENSSSLIEAQNINISSPNTTLVIEAGKKNKLRAGDILGALTSNGELTAQEIGKISIHDRQSYIAIQKSKIQTAYKILKNGKIKGRKFSSWILK